VPFFIYNYPSANVSGLGDIVEPFEEEPLNFELYTPNIAYDSALVYQTFKQQIADDVALSSFEEWDKLDSKNIFERISDPVILNDLYTASCLAYPELKKEEKKGWFLSGSTFVKPYK
jgi:4-diphosphocytidyl-2-C-methyl-D-erythritol kinase